MEDNLIFVSREKLKGTWEIGETNILSGSGSFGFGDNLFCFCCTCVAWRNFDEFRKRGAIWFV